MHFAAYQPFSILLTFSSNLVDMLVVATAAVGTRFLCVLHHDLSAHIVAACSVATSGRLGGAGTFQATVEVFVAPGRTLLPGILYLPGRPWHRVETSDFGGRSAWAEDFWGVVVSTSAYFRTYLGRWTQLTETDMVWIVGWFGRVPSKRLR